MADPLSTSDPSTAEPPRQLELLPPLAPVPPPVTGEGATTGSPEPPSALAPAAPTSTPVIAARARARVPWLRLAVVGLVIALGATAFWGYSTHQTLDQTQADLATANTRISSLNTQITNLGEQITSAQQQNAGLSSQVASLKGQVSAEDSCISALAGSGKVLSDVYTKQNTLYDLYATGSPYDKASRARDAALVAAANDDYDAYSSAWDGAYATANSWVSKANSQISAANKDLVTMNAQIALGNQMLAEINGMLEESPGSDLAAACGLPSATPAPNA